LIPNLLNKKAYEIFKINGNDYDTPDGTAIRDYIHVLDVVDAFKLGLSASQLRTYTILNLGTGLGNSVMDVITNYNRTFESELKYKFIKKRKGDPPTLVTNNHLAKIELGWEPRRNLMDILNDYKHRAL
jgi:UDP-glucose 4-epimerase